MTTKKFEQGKNGKALTPKRRWKTIIAHFADRYQKGTPNLEFKKAPLNAEPKTYTVTTEMYVKNIEGEKSNNAYSLIFGAAMAVAGKVVGTATAIGQGLIGAAVGVMAKFALKITELDIYASILKMDRIFGVRWHDNISVKDALQSMQESFAHMATMAKVFTGLGLIAHFAFGWQYGLAAGGIGLLCMVPDAINARKQNRAVKREYLGAEGKALHAKLIERLTKVANDMGEVEMAIRARLFGADAIREINLMRQEMKALGGEQFNENLNSLAAKNYPLPKLAELSKRVEMLEGKASEIKARWLPGGNGQGGIPHPDDPLHTTKGSEIKAIDS